MVSFVKQSERDIAWKNRKYLKGTGIILKEDLPQSLENSMKVLLPYHKEQGSKMSNQTSLETIYT